MDFFVELQPLFDNNYSGIPRVASSIISRLLTDKSVNPRFFFGEYEVPKEVVEIAILDDSGLRFNKLVHEKKIPISYSNESVALFPNYKSHHGNFGSQGFILHDLSVHRFPNLHSKENVKRVKESLLKDVETSDKVFCVSHSTKKEYLEIFGDKEKEKFIVVHNGIDHPKNDNVIKGINKKLITILGTIEPRKNIDIVLRLISENKNNLQDYQFIFPGKYGWGSSIDEIIKKNNIKDLVENGFILFPGFISETQKDILLNSTFLLIYPSIYEGFGLPVGEALIRNTPVLTTICTSLPEVGGSDAFYFKAGDYEDFKKVFFETILFCENNKINSSDRIKNLFSWDDAYTKIKYELLDSYYKKLKK